jgi:hypothetical protein
MYLYISSLICIFPNYYLSAWILLFIYLKVIIYVSRLLLFICLEVILYIQIIIFISWGYYVYISRLLLTYPDYVACCISELFYIYIYIYVSLKIMSWICSDYIHISSWLYIARLYIYIYSDCYCLYISWLFYIYIFRLKCMYFQMIGFGVCEINNSYKTLRLKHFVIFYLQNYISRNL